MFELDVSQSTLPEDEFTDEILKEKTNVFIANEKIEQMAWDVLTYLTRAVENEEVEKVVGKYVRYIDMYPDCNDIRAADWIFVLHTLNFSLWSPKGTDPWTVDGYTGFSALCAAMKRAVDNLETKVYGRRWLILVIFVLYSASNAMQWIQYSIIANIVMQYYRITSFLVDMTSMIYMITYIPLIFPASYLLDKLGLRYAALFGALGTTLGSWVKVLSVSTDRFWITFIGQSLVAISQTFILSVPARLAAVWFGPDQVSSACSIGVFGNQLGIAIGFLFPPMLVPSYDDVCDDDCVQKGLRLMFYIVAAFSTLVLILIVLFFKSAPPLPPSAAQAVQRENTENKESFFQSIKRLFTNIGYLLLLLSYGINVGIFYAISTLLNQIVLEHFPKHEKDAGRIGLTIVCAGMLGSVVCGIVLDKTHKFKETTLGVYLCSFVGMIIFTFTLASGKIYVVYITAGLLGFFMTGYLPVGFELAAELTYPEPEGTAAGLLNAVVQIFGIAFTTLYGHLFGVWGDFWANIALCVTLALGAFITTIIPNDLRRQNAKA